MACCQPSGMRSAFSQTDRSSYPSSKRLCIGVKSKQDYCSFVALFPASGSGCAGCIYLWSCLVGVMQAWFHTWGGPCQTEIRMLLCCVTCCVSCNICCSPKDTACSFADCDALARHLILPCTCHRNCTREKANTNFMVWSHRWPFPAIHQRCLPRLMHCWQPAPATALRWRC